MPAVVNLQAENLSVEPGQSTTAELSLANTGTIVEQFTIMLLGDVAPWTESDPPVVSLFPGGQQTVTLRFSPPRLHTTPAGPIPFAVKVIPSNEPDESVTEEGVITVGSFSDVGAELVPRVTTGRVAGRQKLAVDSRGNTPLPVAVTAIDAAEALKFQIRPQRLNTAPGEARFIRVRIKPRQRFWKGPPQQKPYQVHVNPENEPPLVLDGALTQKAVLPRWVLPLLGLAAVLALLWFFVLRPIVHNDAVNASKAALAVAAAQNKALAGQVGAASQTANAASATAAQALAAATGKKAPPATTTTTVAKKVVGTTTTTTVAKPTGTTQPPPVTGPNDGRIEVIVAPGTTNTNSITILPKSTLQVTDIVIQNVSGAPNGGRARVQRIAGPPGSTPQDLLAENLGTLTDQEFRFTTPVVFTSGQQLQLSVTCVANQPACDVGIYFTGPLTQPVSDTTTTFH